MIASLEKFAVEIAQVVALYFAIFGLALIVERRHPIEPGQPKSAIFLDYKLVFANVILSRAFAPISGVIVAMWISMAGGGLIPLRADGWWFPLSLALVVLAVEVQGYWFHRLQHCVPFFWSMHSLHHSAEAMTLATGARHYWLEQAIIFSFMPSIAMLFKIPPEIARVLPYCFLTEYLAHMNVNVPFGPLVYIFNTPQFHRIHHSLESRHYNKNFCKNLPLMDIIFGTAMLPGKNDILRTGLPDEKPSSLLEGIVWPIRNVAIMRKFLASIPAGVRRTEAPLPFEVG
jgi:sterol desaturase/sphingolipid hydroxylase (fatty acid hydroxylase superfamily)